MMNTYCARGRDTRAVPAGVIHVETGLRNVVQFDQSKIDVRLGGAERGAALVLAEGTAAELTANRGLVIPIDDHTGSIVRVHPTMVRRQKVVMQIPRGVGDEGSGAQSGSRNAVASHAS